MSSPAGYDAVYEDYIQEKIAEQEAWLIENSYTEKYIEYKRFQIALEAVLKSSETVFSAQIKRASNDISQLKAIPIDDDNHSVVSFDIHLAEEELSNINYAGELTSVIYLSQMYMNLVNAFENYCIEQAKLLLRNHPKDGKFKAKTEISFSELAEIIKDDDDILEFILEKLLSEDERGLSYRTAYPVIEGYTVIKITTCERKAIERAIQVRHKLTHRNGRVDGEFVRKIASSQCDDPSQNAYPLIGNFKVVKGAMYGIQRNEINELIELVDHLVETIDSAICKSFSDMARYDPFDSQRELDEVREAVRMISHAL